MFGSRDDVVRILSTEIKVDLLVSRKVPESSAENETRARSVSRSKTASVLKLPRCKTDYNLSSDSNNQTKKRIHAKSATNTSLTRNASCGKIYAKNRNNLRIYDSMPKSAMTPLFIVNQEEVKRKFIDSKVPPILQFKGNERVVQDILIKHSKPNYKYFFRAKHILELIKSKYGTDSNAYFEGKISKLNMFFFCISPPVYFSAQKTLVLE
jgi:hypothetical protein